MVTAAASPPHVLWFRGAPAASGYPAPPDVPVTDRQMSWWLEQLYTQPQAAQPQTAQPHAAQPHAAETDPTSQVCVRAGLISSVTGASTGTCGTSGALGTALDGAIFRALRSAADVIVVGAGTARSEGYIGLTLKADDQENRLARGASAAPGLVVLTTSGELPPRLSDPADVLLAHPSDSAATMRHRYPADRLITADSPAELVAALADRGHRNILCEGGPQVLAQWSEVLTEVCLTVSPHLAAGNVVGLSHTMPDLDIMRKAELFSVIEHNHSLLLRWLIPPG